MRIYILEKDKQQNIYADAYGMLQAADKEFVPPLSHRSSSTQQKLFGNSQNSDGIQQYFEQLKNQRFAVAFEDNVLIAFVSYKENYSCAEILQNELPNIYISTLIVNPNARGKGVTNALYGMLFEEYKSMNIFTRTWSTNIAHIKILEKYGFKIIKVLENDRGNGIDTIYFKKSPQ